MGIEQRNIQEDGGFSQTELMRAREEDAARLRAHWAKTETQRPEPVGERLEWDGERYIRIPEFTAPSTGPIHRSVIEVERYLAERRRRMLEAQQ
ncbi:MAG: hypothetical protein K0Q89_22 [Thermomicrobiales bacterium]|jgi:hypothetical protein|nr:hypothetical protein [Thermomicrobiales bacterium]